MRALISVYDKTGVADFARGLAGLGFELVSSGGTAGHLEDEGLTVTRVEEVTSAPEMLGGRVKTLHPAVFAGILADRHDAKHLDDLSRHGIPLISTVIVNLYPFERAAAASGASQHDVVEQIDIGGVSLVRAAAKNFEAV
ncbi:MAG: bifunctional phosphoribosylaminoimidazolecarboxamide formyltransferase/IMP cyclohydrolase PurH, partial [Actinobacteria bacterium]|nr:bifunctional phosphoribosylaminoimidazolecarboxamide formyltransferase/IMP cyclohydrolase PurH [Actinomycetota bacterium]